MHLIHARIKFTEFDGHSMAPHLFNFNLMKAVAFLICLLAAVAREGMAQKYFEIEPTFNCACGQFTQKLDVLPRYSEARIKSVFDSLSYKSGMEFRYPQGGCQQRAQMLHQLLDKAKIRHARVWIFAPVDLEEGATTTLDIHDPNHFLPSNDVIKWGYHVAPCVLIKQQNNKVDTLVLDPSLRRDKYLKLSEWFGKLRNSKQASYTFLIPEYYFFNTQRNGASKVINGFFYTYENPNFTFYGDATVERELAVNDVAMFLNAKLDAGYADPRQEVRQLLSNVNNMVGYFAAQQRSYNNIQGVKVRALLTKHPRLMSDAVAYYQQRVNYWLSK
jgi:hypothetical protein